MRLSEKEVFKAIRHTRFRAHCDQTCQKVLECSATTDLQNASLLLAQSQFVILIDTYVMEPTPSQSERCGELTTANGKCRLHKLTAV
jgi:hypothetical protein